jgi:hypothetical protein
MGARSSQMAVVQLPHAVSPSTSFPHGALLPKHAPHASARQGFQLPGARKERSNHVEATDAFANGSMTQPYQIRGGGDSESTGQDSNDAYFQCLHVAAASRFRAMVQLNEEIESSIEQLSSMCLDAVPRKPSAPASFESCLASIAQDPSSSSEAISCAKQDCNTEGDIAARDVYCIQEGAGCPAVCMCAYACGCTLSSMGKTMRRGLLGESGEAITAVHEALKEIEDVHRSDELMHFEFCGPFWELSEV